MNTSVTRQKSVASNLKDELTSAYSSTPKKSTAKKLIIEFQDKYTQEVYSYILYNKGKDFINMSTLSNSEVVTKIDKPNNILIEDILTKLDTPDRYMIVDYVDIWNVNEQKSFDEVGLKHFVKQVKKEILEKIKDANEKKN
jgi:hypothetical protein